MIPKQELRIGNNERLRKETEEREKAIEAERKENEADSFKFVEAPDTYKYQSTTVEIVQGTEFQEIKIDKMWQLLMLIDMLQGVQRHSR